MTKHLYHLSFIMITSTLLVGCGFAPHSVDSLPPKLKQIYYQTDNTYETFTINFKKRLKACGVTLLSAPKKSSPIINVNAHYSYTTNNPASSTQARIYNLSYTAIISITDADNQILLTPQTVNISRNVTLQPNEVFEITPQITITKQEMAQELSTKTLNILAAKKTARDLQKSTK